MTRLVRSFGLAALLAAGLTGVWAASPSLARTAPQGQGAPAPPPGKAVFETVCTGCHDLSVVTEQRKTPDEWAATVDSMIGHGAPLSPEQAQQVVEYLSQAYGKPGG